MADEASIKTQRPIWLPDTQGFLAIAIIAVVSGLAYLLLLSDIKFDDKVAGAFMTLLGVLTACLKDVYNFFFGSSRGSEKKDDVISAIAAQPIPPTPAPAAPALWWSKLSDAEKNAITTAARGPAGGMPDARIGAFVTASQIGAATPDDLAYLVGKGLLTQARADEIQK